MRDGSNSQWNEEIAADDRKQRMRTTRQTKPMRLCPISGHKTARNRLGDGSEIMSLASHLVIAELLPDSGSPPYHVRQVTNLIL